MKREIICIGDYHADVVVRKRDVPNLTPAVVENMWNGVPMAGVTYPPGGAGHTASCAIRRLGGSPLPFGVVGGDHLGQVSLDDLREKGIPTDFLTVDPTRHSITVICMADDTGERSFAYGEPMEASADVTFTEDMVQEEMLQRAGMLYLSGIRLIFPPANEAALKLMETCRSRGIKTAVDLNMRTDHYAPVGELLERYRRSVALADIVFGSGEEELMVVTGEKSPYAASRAIAAMGKIAVCKMGARGAAVFTPNRAFYHRGYPATVVDTIGAGDNFVGGFLASYMDGCPLEECLMRANGVGSFSVGGAGANHSPTVQQLKEWMDASPTPVEDLGEE